MVNFMQSNQDIVHMVKQKEAKEELCFNVIDETIWSALMEKIKANDNIDDIATYVYDISTRYNVDKKNIIKDFLNYIIRNHPIIVNRDFLKFVENIMHAKNTNNHNHVYHALSRLQSFLHLCD